MLFCIIECLFSTCGLLTIGFFAVVYYLFESNRLAEIRQRYDILRQRRQRHVKEAIEHLQKQLEEESDKNADITKQTLVEIKGKIDKGELKATDVLKAFQARALKLHEKCNCIVEPVQEAEADALAVDEKKRTGLLAGIPVTIKDDIGIKDYVTTAGLAKMLGPASSEDSVLVKILRKNGAVIFARTNIPQAELSAEPGNPIYGVTRNPHDPNRGPGGSSSGEGCLVGGGGSLLGFGSDIGGSIRIPAHFSGCCGFKPSSDRISPLGNPKFLEKPALTPTWGPLARDVDSLVLAMKALWDGSMREFDPLYPPITFQNQVYEDKQPLKIGYFYDIKFFPTMPVVRRALDMAIAELRKQGHQVVEWIPPDIETVDELFFKAVLADGGDNLLNALEGDKIDDTIKMMVDPYRLPRFLRSIIPFLAKRFLSEKQGVLAEAMLGTGSVFKLWQLEGKLKEYQCKVTEEWKKAGLDALLSPPLPFPALPLGNPEHSNSSLGHTALYNILDFPAGVVRMTKQTEEDIQELGNYKPNESVKIHAEIKEMVRNGKGLPAGVMVGALRWEDEKCLRVMKAVEKAADFVIQ